MTGKIKSART